MGGSGVSLSMYWKKKAWGHLWNCSRDVGEKCAGNGIVGVCSLFDNFCIVRRMSYGSKSSSSSLLLLDIGRTSLLLILMLLVLFLTAELKRVEEKWTVRDRQNGTPRLFHWCGGSDDDGDGGCLKRLDMMWTENEVPCLFDCVGGESNPSICICSLRTPSDWEEDHIIGVENDGITVNDSKTDEYLNLMFHAANDLHLHRPLIWYFVFVSHVFSSALSLWDRLFPPF